MKKNVMEISPEVITLLMNYGFPGNVRELENIIERGVALSNGTTIEAAHLPEDLRELSIRTFRKREGKIRKREVRRDFTNQCRYYYETVNKNASIWSIRCPFSYICTRLA